MMESTINEEEEPKLMLESQEEKTTTTMTRKEKRKEKKKLKRKQIRKEIAETIREEEEKKLNDPDEQRRREEAEEEERRRMESDRLEFEERERRWLEEMERKRKEEEEEQERRLAKEKEEQAKAEEENECDEDDDWEYVEEGPAEIIWKGNEIIVRKKKVKVPKKNAHQAKTNEDADRPTSNPLAPDTESFAEYENSLTVSAQQMLENVARQVPNFGTELDKAHCPFHLKTGACRFGQRCSRVHFYPDKANTLLIKNMYNGPGLACEQDEGLEHTDEEVERSYEEFYEDVHTEFLKYGEIANFKACRNSSAHLRGNVYVHYKSLDSAVLAYNSINGRYFAGKQLTCEFVNITRWKVAICGEYMKSRLKTCSRGMSCNFIHCFRNPGGDYEWADWDKPPPRYWVKKMAALFGYSDGFVELEKCGTPRMPGKTSLADTNRRGTRRSRSREDDHLNCSSRYCPDDENTFKDEGRKTTGKLRDSAARSYYDRGRRKSHDSSSDGDRPRREREKSRGRREHSEGKGSKHDRKASDNSFEYMIVEGNGEAVAGGDNLDGNQNSHSPHVQEINLGHKEKQASLDDNRDRKDKDYEAGGNTLDRDRDGEKCDTSIEKEAEHRRPSENVQDSKGRTLVSESQSTTELSDRKNGRDRHHHRSESSRHRRSLSKNSNHFHGDIGFTYDNGTSNNHLNGEKERSHGHPKHSRHSEPESSDEELNAKRSKRKSRTRDSRERKSSQKRRKHLGKDISEVHSYESDHHHTRSETYAGGLIAGVNEQDRWEPNNSDYDNS